jgi:hypothetical protein
MPTQFKITVTREIIEKCKNCGNNNLSVEENCAIALALHDIFPNVYVTNYYIFPFGHDDANKNEIKMPMPLIAQKFVKLFDGFRLTPKLRLLLPEFDFTIEIPDEVIDQVNIDEIKAISLRHMVCQI